MMRRTWMLVAVAAFVVVILLGTAATVVASGGAGPASPAPVAEPAPSPTATPALTLVARPAIVTAGDPATLAVRLGIPGAIVQLGRKTALDTDFHLIGPLTTDARGVATFRARPGRTTTYRVDYAGDEIQWLPAAAEAVVSVHPQVSFSAPERVYRGKRARLAVTVRPAHPGATVVIERRQDGAWAEWRNLTLGSTSRAQTTWRADAVGAWPLRVTVVADADHLGGVSRVRRVQVVRPNPYNVPLDAKGIVVVDVSQYRLRFYSYGTLLKSFPCVTGRPSLPTPIGHFSIYARGMWPGGPYGARIMSYHPPCAIHGTNEPWLLKRFPRNFSHGCTRLANANAIWLYDHAPLGTPVWNVP
jgi:lipoprotein-anchoring transpeptidase ErfK/SrfK